MVEYYNTYSTEDIKISRAIDRDINIRFEYTILLTEEMDKADKDFISSQSEDLYNEWLEFYGFVADFLEQTDILNYYEYSEIMKAYEELVEQVENDCMAEIAEQYGMAVSDIRDIVR